MQPSFLPKLLLPEHGLPCPAAEAGVPRRAAVAARGTQDQTRPDPGLGQLHRQKEARRFCASLRLSAQGASDRRINVGQASSHGVTGDPAVPRGPEEKQGKNVRRTRPAGLAVPPPATSLGTVRAAYYRVGSRLQAWETYGSWLQ